MNLFLLGPELVLIGLGLSLLMADLVVPPERRRFLGAAAAVVAVALGLYVLRVPGIGASPAYAFGERFVVDGLSAFFKAIFLTAGALVLVLAMDWAKAQRQAVTEYFVLILFALAGMMMAASANDFTVMYVSLELVTVTENAPAVVTVIAGVVAPLLQA